MTASPVALLKLIRPHQYIKNLFIFMPLFFAGQIQNAELLTRALIAFLAFSLAASAVYVLNDFLDIEEDRKHPSKRHRPLASGAVSKGVALFLMGVLVVLAATIMAYLSTDALVVMTLYIVMNIGYSLQFKHVAILDITIIATGFVLRLFIGATVTATPLSSWIVIMTFLLALFLALAKRRDDALLFLNTGEKMRRVVGGYTLQLIDVAMAIMASVVIVAYLLYTTSAEVIERMQTELLYLTTVFVIVGILRYLQITFVSNESGSPTKALLKDRFLQTSVIAWAGAYAWILYL